MRISGKPRWRLSDNWKITIQGRCTHSCEMFTERFKKKWRWPNWLYARLSVAARSDVAHIIASSFLKQQRTLKAVTHITTKGGCTHNCEIFTSLFQISMLRLYPVGPHCEFFCLSLVIPEENNGHLRRLSVYTSLLKADVGLHIIFKREWRWNWLYVRL